MRHPTRFLIEYVAGELSPARETAVGRHLERCGRCRDTVEQERLIRRRLQSATTPEPSEDLCDRILRKSAATPAMHPGSFSASASNPFETIRQGDEGTFTQRNRAAIAVGSGLTVAAIATLSAAYALGTEVHPEDPLAASGSASVAESFETVATDASVRLTSSEIRQLRRDGWFCPELQTLGFELVRAEALEIDDRPTLQLDLSDGNNALTVYEQRSGTMDQAQVVPINAVTGNTVHEDGFEEIGGTEQTVWLHPGRSWQLVIDSGSATYTVVSTLPVSDMPRTVSQLMFNERSQLAYSRPDAPEDPLSRILRGLRKLSQPAP